MAFPLAWPEALRPSSESWVIENADRSGGVSITGSEQIVSTPGGRWRAKLTFMLFSDEAPVMRALILGLRGRSGTVLVGPFDMTGAPRGGVLDPWAAELGIINDGQPYPAPREAEDVAATLYASATLRARSLSIRMQAGRRPSAGNYVSVANRLYVLTGVTPQGAPNDFTCSIEPPLKQPAAFGAPVDFINPVCVMRLATPVDRLPISASTFATDVTLDLVEAF